MKQIWFVTGTTSGVGCFLVRRLLAEGRQVAATSRSREKLEQLFGPESGQFLPLSLPDLADEGAVLAARDRVAEKFGGVDVVVNNAGYALCGAFEETSDREARDIFDVNFFGAVNVIRAFLPVMRRQRSGCFLNINSIAGITCRPDGSMYNATKFALDAVSKTVREETRHLGITSVSVNMAGIRSRFHANQRYTALEIPDYAPAKEVRKLRLGPSPGNPSRVVEMLLRLAELEDPPANIVLGAGAYPRARAAYEEGLKNLADWEAEGTAIDNWAPGEEEAMEAFGTGTEGPALAGEKGRKA